MPLSAGIRLGPYEILGPLGAGGMGEVYRATDTRLHREVAIKVSAQHFSDRFEREARAIASLNHPNICTLHDVGPNYLVMELVEGPTLADCIANGAIPLDETLRIAHQITDALEAAHDKNIVHRDLKPANIKIKPDGTVKVLDFGLAKIGGMSAGATGNLRTISMSLTQPGAILGTAAYMSPEQARGRIADKRADIWAFGVVMYEMLTGRRPFRGEGLSETVASVIKDEPRWNGVPLRIRRLLKRCLEKDPKRRLSDIADVWGLLDDEQRLSSRFGIAGWITAGVLAVALVLALWSLRRVPTASDRPLIRLLADLGADGGFSDTVGPLTISPDGRRLALAQGGRLWMRALDEDRSAALPGTEGAYDPFFSPDGLWIGFGQGARLWKVSVRGGAPVPLCDAPALRGASWGTDGSIVAALQRVGGLWKVPENGGKPDLLTHTDPQSEITSHRFPQVLGDGSAVLFTAGSGTDPNGNLIVAQSLKTGRQKILWKGGTRGRYLPGGYLVFVYQNTLYAAPMSLKKLALTGQPQPVLENIAVSPLGDSAWFDVAESGTLVFLPSQAAERKQSVVRLVSGAAAPASPLLPDRGSYSEIRLSPDGKRLLLAGEQNHITDIWIDDIARAVPAKLTFGRVVKTLPRWAPDGRYAFFFTRSGSGDGIAAVRADGTGEVAQLLDGRPSIGGYSISPDGRTIAFAERGPGTGLDLWTFPVDLSGGLPKRTGEPRVFLRTPGDESSPAISPDGRWIAYVSNESGRNEVYVRPYPAGRDAAGGERLASVGGGIAPDWPANRHDLFYQNLSRRIMAVSYTASGDVFSVDKPRLWSPVPVGDYDIAPDADSAVAVVDSPAGGDRAAPVEAVFLFNFFDELRRRVPAGK